MEQSSREVVAGAMSATDLGAFFDATFPRIFGYFVRRCPNRALAEDLTQDTFIAAATSIGKGTEVLDPDHWIFGLARHRLVDHFRALDREQRKLRIVWDAEHSVEQGIESAEVTSERVYDALRELSPIHRLVLSLRYLDGLSPSEIAIQIGRSLHATESLISRGRQSFRTYYLENSNE
jgi:RNA polymerase sigma-70 factor (ECF subfamily)